MLVQLARQFAHEPAALGGTEPRTNGFGNDAVAEQRGGFGRLGGHGAGPPNGDGAIQSAPAPGAQGEVVWVPSAWPPLIRLQNDQGLPMRSPNRATARCQATRSPSSAARSRATPTLTSTAVPSRATASAVHWASNRGDRDAEALPPRRAAWCAAHRAARRSAAAPAHSSTCSPARARSPRPRRAAGRAPGLAAARAIADTPNTEPAESRSVRPATVRAASASSHPSQRATADRLDTAVAARPPAGRPTHNSTATTDTAI